MINLTLCKWCFQDVNLILINLMQAATGLVMHILNPDVLQLVLVNHLISSPPANEFADQLYAKIM